MRKCFLAIMAAVMLLVYAGIASAQTNVDIGIKNKNNFNIYSGGGNAEQNQAQWEWQQQFQKQFQLQNAESTSSSGGNTYEAAKNYITASTLQNFVAAVTPSTPLGWKQLGCDFIVAEFTVGQLRKMAEGASFMKKRGTFWYSVLTDDVELSIFNSTGIALSDSTVIRIVVKVPRRVKSNLYFGEAEGIGRYGAPMGQILGATVLRLVLKTGVTQVVISWDYLIEGLAMANTFGAGVAGSATNGEAGSIAIGGAGSTTYNLTSIAYRIKAQAFTGLGEDYFSCGPVSYAPEPKGCDPNSIWDRIYELKRLVKDCITWCFNNLQLRSKLGEAYIDLYQCTGDKKYLSSAIEQFKIAESNSLLGHDIKDHQAEAKRLMDRNYYFWSGCINILRDANAADDFAAKHGIEKVPQL